MATRAQHLLIPAVALLWAPSVLASATYPGAIRNHLELETSPACTLCHADAGGGMDTVVTPFGIEMMDRGLGRRDNDKLRSVLDELDASDSDVDGDGVSDIDELIGCGDPNSASEENLCNVEQPTFGCVVTQTQTRSTTSRSAALLGAFLGAAMFLRRRRRRSESL